MITGDNFKAIYSLSRKESSDESQLFDVSFRRDVTTFSITNEFHRNYRYESEKYLEQAIYESSDHYLYVYCSLSSSLFKFDTIETG